MSAEIAVAALVVAALAAYAVLAGADFGGGIWDLFAAGPRRDQQRAAIANAIAPVWEANHVWLIFVIVLLFTAFPPAFYAISVGLFVPLHIVLFGIVLRGAAFVFRAYGPTDRPSNRRWGDVFGTASTVTPVLLGMCLGAVCSGWLRIQHDEVVDVARPPWLTSIAIVLGAFALANCAYLAAVYLTSETDGALREDFRRRALAAGSVVVALSLLAIPVLRRETPHLFRGLTSVRALPVLCVGAFSALSSGYALLVRRYRLARLTAAAQVALLVVGWALAQYPYLIYPDVTLHGAAAPAETLEFVLLSAIPGAAILVPAIWWLFRVFKRPGAA